MTERITQRTDTDCQTAVAAMLSDRWSYDDLAGTYGTPMTMSDIVSALETEGYHYSWLGSVESVDALADLAHHHDRLYAVIESPVSERDPDLYHEIAASRDGLGESFSVTHAIAVRDGRVLDPKPDPYVTGWSQWRDLAEQYPVVSACMFTRDPPRTLDFTDGDADAD